MARARDLTDVRPRVAPHVEWAELDGEVVVLHANSGRYYVLTDTSALLWQFLDGSATVGALAEDVAAAFAVPLPEARRDLDTFVRDMVRRNVVVLDAPRT